jgi:hypothetical protein
MRWVLRHDFADPPSARNPDEHSIFCNDSPLSPEPSNSDTPSREVLKLAAMNDLFPADIDLGQRRVINGGCAEPIGKQGRPRRRGYRAPPRPTTLNVLTDIRRVLNSDLATLRQGQQQIRQGQHSQASLLSETNDLLQNLVDRVSKLERAVGLVEQPRRLDRPAIDFSISANEAPNLDRNKE